MSWYTCSECDFMDLKDNNRYGDCYCTRRGHYYPKSDSACNLFEKNGRWKGSDSHCYITTCVSNILGEDDNGYHLNALRKLRDNYMKHEVDCYSMLREYNVIGPSIAKAIYNDSFREEMASDLMICYIEPTVSLAEQKRYEEAIDKYIAMNNYLLDYYGITDRYNEEDVDVEISEFMQRKRTFI